MIVGTAGHIDHGKTTLVRALTGVDADRLPEEKRRGMTIDLGYAYGGPLGFVDVPGHERFVHTMLAGAGGIDAALLVVAADDGVMPQTREHASILSLLGIASGVVAITRIDRAPERVSVVADEIRALLAGTAMASAPISPVCAPSGEGVEKLRTALLALDPRSRNAAGFCRLAVDRVFTLAGTGTVVTGTLVDGVVEAGDRLVVSPAGTEVRVRGLHAHNRPAHRAEAGQRVALNLSGAGKNMVSRGDWILAQEIHAPTSLLDARITWLTEAPNPRGDGISVHVHLAAAHVTARAVPLGGDGFVRLTLDRPIGALVGDRVVLRDAAATRTVGGGTVVDPWPPRRGARGSVRIARLGWISRPPAEALRGELLAGSVDFSVFSRGHNLRPPEAAALLASEGGVLAGNFALPAARPAAMRTEMSEALAAHHAAHPDEPGPQPEILRRSLAEKPPVELFRAVLETALRRGEIEADGPWLRLPIHRAALTPDQERIFGAAKKLIEAGGFCPPRTRDLATALCVPEDVMRATLKRLTRAGRLVEVAHDHFFPRAAVAAMIAIAADLGGMGALSAAAFRDRLGIGRKVAIQILEFFDRAGVTRRDGDDRTVVPSRMDLFGAASDGA